jgi:hypothetical protein
VLPECLANHYQKIVAVNALTGSRRMLKNAEVLPLIASPDYTSMQTT